MDTRQLTAMAEATRLTREGRLAEATALIQQTLASPVVTTHIPDTTSAAEQTVGTPLRALDPAPPSPSRDGIQLTRFPHRWIRRRVLPGRVVPKPRPTKPPTPPTAVSTDEPLAGGEIRCSRQRRVEISRRFGPKVIESPHPTEKRLICRVRQCL